MLTGPPRARQMAKGKGKQRAEPAAAAGPGEQLFELGAGYGTQAAKLTDP